MSQVVELPIGTWSPEVADDEAHRYAALLESGKVLHLPRLAFELRPEERRFLDPRWSDPKAKNISYDPANGRLKGARGNAADLHELCALVERFHRQALGLIERLAPGYAAHLRGARASFRPQPVAGRVTSWRKDDTRLHVDAFPSRPNHGERILRVFANVNPHGVPRVWRVGEPFEDLARRFVPQLPRPLPGSAALLAALRITKSRRSRYDHIMLALHDRMKADLAYQKNAPQETIAFLPGCTWICFSDQTSHAAMSGQYLFEQTVHLPVAGLYDPARSPLKILERLAGRALV
ncbi:MAG: Kdo hydroxylase family protein [Sinobacteraceae bacterium]|nr:Kdo hydroxylase family protein [Nevskiaceae bacterium]